MDLSELFGKPLGHFPEYWAGWDGPPCTIYWAPASCWNYHTLRDLNVPFKFNGPFSPESTPFPVPCRGYSIIVLDEE